MARIRSVKPELWTDRKLARLSRDARLLYIALWNQSDEHSRLQGDSRYVKGHCLPYDDDLTLRDVERLVDELAEAGRVIRYDHDGDPYLYLPRLAKHQRLDPRVVSRLPEPPQAQDDDSEPDADESGSHTDKSGSHTDESARDTGSSGGFDAKQVAGSRWQVAGGRGSAAVPPQLALVPAPEPEPDPPAKAEAPAQQVVRAYIDGATSAGLPTPGGSLPARVGKQAKAMLATTDLTVLLAAASAMGATGWHDLAVQVQQDAARGRKTSAVVTVGYADADRYQPSRSMTGAEWAAESRGTA